jgi:alpha-mannosidase
MRLTSAPPLAGGQVDGSSLGICGQNGATRFLQRFTLRPHGAYDAVAAMKFGLESQNPLITSAVIGQTNSPYAADRYSLLTIDHPAVLLWALKPHDDGIEHGMVARVWNLAPEPSAMRLTSAPPLAGARRVTHIETPLETLVLKDGFLETSIPAHRIESYSLTPLR